MYTDSQITGDTNMAKITVRNATLFFVVTATDANGIESDPSNEVVSPRK
jgi:hypothetical protein